MFRNIILLIVLVSGLVAGYFVGSYKGREAMEALEKEKALQETLKKDHDAIQAGLQQKLGAVEDQRKSQLEEAQKKYQDQSAQWEKSKANLDATIKKQTVLLANTNRDIDSLVKKLPTATGAERAKLEAEIARLRQQAQSIQVEADGTRCLQVQAPRAVIDALGK